MRWLLALIGLALDSREALFSTARLRGKKQAGPKPRPFRRFSKSAYLPVPDRATFCGLSGALSVNVRLPVRNPVCVGANATFTTQLALGASVLPQALFFGPGLRMKSPLVAMLVMFSVALPMLVSVTVFAPLTEPTSILPHFNDVGLRLTAGPPPPPVHAEKAHDPM